MNILVASSLIKSIIDNNDMKEIKKNDYYVLDYINDDLIDCKISSLELLLELLIESKKAYYEIYLKCLTKGILDNPTDKIEINFLDLKDFIYQVKRMLGKTKHISFLLDCRDEMSLDSYKIVNDYIGSRITGTMSINVLTEYEDWKSFTTNNGQYIEAIHDYNSIDYDDNLNKVLTKKMNR